MGVTSAALLAFLGSGYTHSAGDYSSTVRRGLDWLRKQQRADGSFKTGSGAEWMYGHALATVVVCEAYAMTGDEKLKDPCLKALGFILTGQNRDGGWRYSPAQGTSDSSVTTSMLVALKAAKDAGLAVPKKTVERAFAFLDRVTDDKGMTGYVKRGDKTSTKAPVLTAATLLCRLLHGQSGDDPKVKQGIEILRKSIPAWYGAKGDKLEMYYIYWATQAVFHSGGGTWKEWNRAMKKTLLESQRKDGCARGSWNPDGTWVKNGGRVLSTAINCLTLEVYYRYLPVHSGK